MKIRQLHIIALAILMSGVICSCSKEDTTVIPRKKMARIYADMLMTDQWVTSTPGIRMVADTSLVYEPILEKYGYDSDDYRMSIDAYMDDPERFARILRTTGEIIQDRIDELKQQQRILDMKANLPKLNYNISWNEFFPYMFDEPYVHNYDSIAFEPDSVLWIYRLKSIERSDTIYDRIRMIILDSLSVKDSLPCLDSLAVADTLARIDSIAAADSVIDNTVLKLKDEDIKPQALKSAFELKSRREIEK
jgi:hypothetical protein